ncbi:hypothetical protein PM082_014124 [Marasmius tenuissimus]|nr:hypothetical protein PM082_014124 [Marasmius tenuissimus]
MSDAFLGFLSTWNWLAKFAYEGVDPRITRGERPNRIAIPKSKKEESVPGQLYNSESARLRRAQDTMVQFFPLASIALKACPMPSESYALLTYDECRELFEKGLHSFEALVRVRQSELDALLKSASLFFSFVLALVLSRMVSSPVVWFASAFITLVVAVSAFAGK